MRTSETVVTTQSEYGAQNALGREKADQLILQMRLTQNPTLLGAAIRDIVNGGTYGPVEVGFCQRLADQILAG